MQSGEIHANRISKLRELLIKKKVDAFITVSMENIFYLTGFTGSDGILLVAGDRCVLFTDTRYMLQVREEVKSAKVLIYKDKTGALSDLQNEATGDIIGFNSVKISHYLYKDIRRALKGKRLKDCGATVERLRQIKDAAELRTIKEAVKRAERSYDAVFKSIAVGDSESDIKARLECEFRKSGCEKESFDTIVVSGKNSVLVHGSPTMRKIRGGDFVLIDYGVKYKRYCTDMTRTFVAGEPSPKQRKIYNIVREAQRLAIAQLRDGVSSKHIDNTAREYIARSGYGDYFLHGLGHGVGIEIHEPPALSQNSDCVLKEGMVLTIEPGVYIENFGGIRIEDMVYITKTGSVMLSKGAKEL